MAHEVPCLEKVVVHRGYQAVDQLPYSGLQVEPKHVETAKVVVFLEKWGSATISCYWFYLELLLLGDWRVVASAATLRSYSLLAGPLDSACNSLCYDGRWILSFLPQRRSRALLCILGERPLCYQGTPWLGSRRALDLLLASLFTG